MAHESTWHRASMDTEHFRSKRRWFWGVEVIGAGAIAGLTAGILWERNILHGWQVGLITFGVFAVSFLVIYGMIFLWNLFRAPYRQLNEARTEIERLIQRPVLTISYRDQKWGFPNANVPDTTRMVKIGIDYNPSRLMQIAKIFITIENKEPRYEAWSQHQFNIDKPEYHESWFYLPDEEQGIKKAKLWVLANNNLWESDEFDLNIPPTSRVNLLSKLT